MQNVKCSAEMSLLLHSCCSPPAWSNSTPSFTESGLKSNISRASKAAYENRSEIILIKKCKSTWTEDDEKSSSTMISNSSLEVNTGSAKSCSKLLKRKNSYIKNPLLGFPEENPDTRLDLWIQSTLEAPENSEYAVYSKKRSPVQNTNKFLDWITMCFWKCSPGCQQIPEFNS